MSPALWCLALLILLAGADRSLADSDLTTETVAPLVVPLDSDGVQRTTVTADSYSFTPSHLIVQAGTPVELVLTSVTIITPHNFVLKAPEAGLDVDQDIGSGDTVTVRFTPTQAGTFTFYCDKKLLFFPSHREEGMEGLLEVRR